MAKKRRVVKKKPVKPIVKDEEVKPVETVKEPESVAEPKAEQVKQVPEPPKPEAPEPPKEKGMVSIDKVLECFDNANENTKKALLTSHREIIDYCVNYIRKSLENIVNG